MVHHGETGQEDGSSKAVEPPESPLSIKLKAVVADLRNLADEVERMLTW